ncbi:MAG TPA: c-type cytochrome [Verrucomicrobiae bacterium]
MRILFAILVAAVAWPAFAQTPEWIWHGETNATTVYFRKAFRSPPLLWNSRLTVSADDEAEVFLNGVSIARCTDWRRPSRSEVTVRLNQGDNVIAVKAQVKEGANSARGLLVHLNLGGEINLVSDGTWLTSATEELGWAKLDFNAAHWKSAKSLGQHGIEPWGDVLFRPGATAPENITVPEGFKVELLRSAEPAEGSWICMAFDDRGRIIVSPQGESRSLLRLTLGTDKVESVEKIEAPISYAMGLLQAFDSLYVNGIGPRGSGLYRLIDANKNDRYETNELHFLKGFKGGSEHGYHALALGPDKKIYVLNGNGTKLPEGISPKSPYRNYAEDALTGARGDDLPGTKAPNCHVLRTDAEGKEWELFAGGMRNAYDMDFNADGELFTFDSDNEWDWGVPWYRPTRVIHLVSGGDAGWRDGTRMWAEDYSGAVPTVANVGIGSPTGVKFARGENFPPKFRRALFLQDWSYGRILAVHLTESGASYTGQVEKFLEGAPLNVTSLSFGPEGAMYFTTGGRGTQSGLYRVSYTGEKQRDVFPVDPAAKQAREERRKLEAMHSGATRNDLDFILPRMFGNDSAIRYAARVAIESAPLENWTPRALQTVGLTPLLVLARIGSAEDQAAVLKRVRNFRMPSLSEARRLAKLRVIQVSLARHGVVAKPETDALVSELIDFLPRASEAVKRESMRVLLHVKAPGAVTQAVRYLQESQSGEEQLFYIELLRNVKDGWTLADREKFFAWFLPGNQKARGKEVAQYFADVKRSYVDGASYDGYLRDFRRQAIATLSPEERKALEPLLAKPIAQAQLVPGRTREFVRDWKVEDLLAELGKPRQRDFSRGRQAFVDAQCLMCHRFGNDGGMSGPELTGAGSKYSERDLLESMLEPSKVVSDQYQDHTVFLKDGEVFTGKLISDSEKEVVIEVDRVAGTKEKVPKANVEQIRPATLSPMPSGLVNVLTKEEILDLVSYLRSGVAEPSR